MARSTVYTRTIERAIEAAGGEERLARFLNLPLEHIGQWHRGESQPTLGVFLALVDIVGANRLTPTALQTLNRLSTADREPPKR